MKTTTKRRAHALRAPLFAIAAAVCLLAVIVPAGCQPTDPPPGGGYEYSRDVMDEPQYANDVKPGNYCLVATGERASFLLTDGKAPVSSLLEQRSFERFTWVTLESGDTLFFNDAEIKSEAERREEVSFDGALEDGFFLVGVDIPPGTCELRLSEPIQAGNPVPTCRIYHRTRDLTDDPVRSYELSTDPTRIVVESGEFVVLERAVKVTYPQVAAESR